MGNQRLRHRFNRSVTTVASTVIALLIATACNRHVADDNEIHSNLSKPQHALDSVVVRGAEGALHQFLEASREGSLTRGDLKALTACDEAPGTPAFPRSVLAMYTLMQSDMRGDTVLGRAYVVTVAEQDVDNRKPGTFSARQRIRKDVLEWDVIPSGDHMHWTVCNGVRFGYLGADSLTKWRPDGVNYKSVRRLIDSMVRAHPGNR